MTREAHRFSSNVRQPYEDSRIRKRWPQLEAEARALLDWLAARGYATWTREPGGRRIMPGPDWPGWRPEQRPLIGPPK